ncbi:5-formyltetrahydrofolate cyclo-ligase-like isoform X1 [Drosophila miranda]|uniref:5-formyltetrahydrofolate cyclo-ligase-like isoform X1 n=1 Tax=Drosophila miranda TaxID=7229 RepID=UPI00143F4B2E|nr:5-formyltetrahydrofolate cyclo-ligase-like isoform X1 [Drosophila miranda]
MSASRRQLQTDFTGLDECVSIASDKDKARMASTIQNGLKVALRKSMKDALKCLEPEAIKRQSHAVTAKVLQSESFRQAQRVSIYLSTSGEVDTTELLCEMFRLEKMVFVPSYEGASMKMVRLRGMEEYESLPLTKWNIKQPDFKETREDAMTKVVTALICLLCPVWHSPAAVLAWAMAWAIMTNSCASTLTNIPTRRSPSWPWPSTNIL